MRIRRAGARPSGSSRLAGALRSPLVALAAYSTLAVAMTWPLALRLGSTVPHDLGDPLGLTWVLWWNAQAPPLTTRWLNAPIFFPSPGAIVFQDSLLGVWPLSTPLQWAGVSPLAVHNLLVIASFTLSAFTAFLLCLRLVGHRGAALCGGLVFGFALYRVGQLAHVNVLLTFWVPLVLLGLHAHAETRRRRWLVLAAASWALQGATSGYFLAYTSVLVALWLAFFARRVREAVPVLLAFGLAFAAIWPWVSHYRSIHATYGFERQASEMQSWSADVASLLQSPPLLAAWGPVLGDRTGEDQCFPGLTLVVLCVAAAAGSRYRAAPWLSRGSRWCLGGAAGFAALAAVAVLAPTSFTALGVRVSLARADRPLAWTWLLLLAALALSGPVRRAWQGRSVAAFYALLALLLWILSLGPNARWLGERLWYKAPYSWLLFLPGFDALRVPARIWLLAVLALAVVAAHGLARLARRGPGTARLALALACAGLVAEAWPAAIPLLTPPERVAALESRDPLTPLLELPLDSHERDLAAMYRAMDHHGRLINGYSGHVPAPYVALRSGLAHADAGALVPFAELTPLDVLVHAGTDPAAPAWPPEVALVESLGATLVSAADRHRLYRLPRRPVTVEPPPGTALAVAKVTSGGRDVTARVTDPAASGFVFLDSFDVTLAARSRVGEVQVVMAPGPAAVGVAGAVGTGPWLELRDGPIAERMVRAALADSRYPRLRLRFSPREVERLRVTVRMPRPGDVIGVRELRVFAD